MIKFLFLFLISYDFRLYIYGRLCYKKNFLGKMSLYIINKNYNYISNMANIGYGIVLPHKIGIVIEDNVYIGNNCSIYQNVTIQSSSNEPTIIGDNVIIYANSIIKPGSIIASNCIVGANSVVKGIFFENSIIGGNNAKLLKFNVNRKAYK